MTSLAIWSVVVAVGVVIQVALLLDSLALEQEALTIPAPGYSLLARMFVQSDGLKSLAFLLFLAAGISTQERGFAWLFVPAMIAAMVLFVMESFLRWWTRHRLRDAAIADTVIPIVKDKGG